MNASARIYKTDGIAVKTTSEQKANIYLNKL